MTEQPSLKAIQESIRSLLIKDNTTDIRESLLGEQGLLQKLLDSLPDTYKDKPSLIDQTSARLLEYADKEIIDWKRIRAAIEHENNLSNHRLTWLFSSQGFLFGAFALLVANWMSKGISSVLSDAQMRLMIGGIAVTGSLICFCIWISLTAAYSQLIRLSNWWYGARTPEDLDRFFLDLTDEMKEKRQRLLRNHPPIQGEPKARWEKYIHFANLPILFVIAWLVVFPAAAWHSSIEDFLVNYSQYISYAVTFVLGFILCAVLKRGSWHSSGR
jgi:hypothetical protein